MGPPSVLVFSSDMDSICRGEAKRGDLGQSPHRPYACYTATHLLERSISELQNIDDPDQPAVRFDDGQVQVMSVYVSHISFNT